MLSGQHPGFAAKRYFIECMAVLCGLAFSMWWVREGLQDIFSDYPLVNSLFLAIGMVGAGRLIYEVCRLIGEGKRLAAFGQKRYYAEAISPHSCLFALLHLLSQSPYITEDHLNMALDKGRKCLQRRQHFFQNLQYALGLGGLIVTLTEMAQALRLGEDFDEILELLGLACSPLIFALVIILSLGVGRWSLGRAYQLFADQVEYWVAVRVKTQARVLGDNKALTMDSIEALLGRWMESIDTLGRLNNASEKRQQDLYSILLSFSERTNHLADLMKAQHSILNKWVDEHTHSRHTLEKISQRLYDIPHHQDDILRHYLNQIAVTCQELLKHVVGERTDLANTIRQEVRRLMALLGNR